MEKPEWWKLYENPALRQHFIDFARNRTSCVYIQQDLVQEAWLRIGEFLAGLDPFADESVRERFSTTVDGYYSREQLDLDLYRRLGEKAIKALYMREWRQWDKAAKLRGLKDRDYRTRKKFRFFAKRRGLARN